MSLRRIRSCVLQENYEYSSHALEEMDEDGLQETDIRSALLNGRIISRLTADPRGVRYIIRATQQAGNKIELVCRFLPSGILRIITVYIVTEER
jgi:hypothetical protein